jgi:hypothetical protein
MGVVRYPSISGPLKRHFPAVGAGIRRGPAELGRDDDPFMLQLYAALAEKGHLPSGFKRLLRVF